MTDEQTPTTTKPPITRFSPLTKAIAAQLNETTPGALILIAKTIDITGEEKAKELCQQALEIQSQGGMLTQKKDRNRTLGGIFFYLAKVTVGIKEWNNLNYDPAKRRQQRQNKKKKNGTATTD